MGKIMKEWEEQRYREREKSTEEPSTDTTTTTTAVDLKNVYPFNSEVEDTADTDGSAIEDPSSA